MDDELRKEKFRCEFNGPDGITISDLHIKAKNPLYSRAVKLKKGEYILTELLEFEDLKKSRLSGALSHFIKKGWVTVENPSVPTKAVVQSAVKEIKAGEPLTERGAGLVAPKDVTNIIADAPKFNNNLDYPKDVQTKSYELVSKEQSRTPNAFAIAETEVPSNKIEESFEKFNSLKYFQKLKAIREMNDIKLLETITSKCNYPQLVHNSKNRLREIQTGK